MKSIHRQKRYSLKGIANFTGRIAVIAVFVFLSTIFLIPGSVQAQPSIFPSSLPEAQVDVYYTTTLVAAPITPPVEWIITSGTLPSGLILNAATGTISGIPIITGTYTFFVTVTDTVGTSSQQGFFIIVNAPPITFDTTSLPRAKEGNDYYEEIEISGGTYPFTWIIFSGTLPSGLTLESDTGIISGIPDKGTAGTHTFTVRVTDSSSPELYGQKTFSILIREGAYESVVTIAPTLLAGEADVFVDGVLETILPGGQSITISFNPGTSHIVTTDSIVSHPTDSAIRFIVEVDTFTITEISPDAYFNYYAEYYINFKTNPPQVAQLTGSGWYREGYELNTSALAEIEDTANTQYHFSYWTLPTGETNINENLSLTVSMPGAIVANYDIYYLLTLDSPYGEFTGDTWFKASSEAQWAIEPVEVPMSGILGFFGGKLQADNYKGTTTMNGPHTIVVTWNPDYTRPAIFISLLVVIIGLVGYALYRRWSAEPEPLQYGMGPPPAPSTTVVMIGDSAKKSPQSTKEQLIDKLGELLDKYETEIKASIETTEIRELDKGQGFDEDRMLPPPTIVDSPGTIKQEEAMCNFRAKKLLRTVASSWKQMEIKNVTLPPSGKKTGVPRPGFEITWSRDIYNEWEILTCSLPGGHEEDHEGDLRIAYSVLNTITEEKVYSRQQELKPPTPHFTDGMIEVEIAADELIPTEKLPTETIS